MATSNNRDVKLGVEIQAAGEENLQRLAVEVRSLAKAGGDAAPKYLELANELDRVAAQARALDAFRTAAQNINEASTASAQATANAERLRLEYAEQATATDRLRTAQAGVRAALDSTQRSISEQRLQLELLKAALAGGSIAQSDYDKQAAELGSTLAVLRDKARQLAIDLREAKSETSDAATALGKLSTASLKADEAARTLQGALRQQASAMDAARAAGERLGADFTDVAVAQERLDASLQGATLVLEQSATAARALAEADALLAIETRGLAEAQERASVAARSELAAIRESDEFVKRYEAGQRATQAAVQALTDDLDRQAATLRGKLIVSLNDAAAAYDKEQAAIAASVAQAAKLEAATREQAEADRLATLAAVGLAEARSRGVAQAESELAAIKDSDDFVTRYTQSLNDAAAARKRYSEDALAFVVAEEKAAAAAARASAELDALSAAARKSNLDAQYVRELAAALDAVDLQASQAAAQVAKLQGYFDKLAAERDVLKGAFGTAGVRSIQDIELEMFKLQGSLVTLRTEFVNGRISIADFDRAVASANVRLGQLKTEIATIPGQRGVFDQLANSVTGLVTKFGALAAVIATVGLAVKPVLDSIIALDSTSRILTQVTGGTAEAARQIEFLRNVAQQSGADFSDVAQSYAKFAASALQAGVSTEQTQAAFKAVALAAGNLGLSSEQAKRALEALSQIASKGTVSMEELRQQLGDALPGVLPLLARQLGLTNQELNKLVESGGLLAQDAIPALTAALGTLANQGKPISGLVAEYNRFINVVKESATVVADGPFGKGIGVAIAAVSKSVEYLVFGITMIGEAFTVVGRQIGVVVAALVTRDFKDLSKALAEIEKESNDRLGNLAIRIGGVSDAAIEATPNLNNAAAANERVASASTQAANGQQALGQAASAAGQAAAASVPQHQAVAAAVTSAGQAATGATTLLAKLAVDYKANNDAADQGVKIAEKLVDARKSEGEALKSLVDLMGNEFSSRVSAAQAAQATATAERAAADARRVVVEVMVAERAALAAQALAEGKLDAARRQSLATLGDKILKEQAAAEKSLQAARAAEAVAAAAKLAAESLRDNSGRVAEFAKEAEAAKLRVGALEDALRRGTISQDDFNRAALDAATKIGLYKDALDDAAKAGVDIREIQTGISNEFFKTTGALDGVITSLKALGLTAEQTNPQLSAALNKQLEAAKTRTEIEFVTAEIKRARDAGLIFGADYEAAMTKARIATEALSPVLRQATKDAEALGITLKDKVGGGAQAGVNDGLAAYERLKASGVASAGEIGDAFVNLANRAIKANQGIVPEWVKVEAAARNARIEVDAVGNATVSAGSRADSSLNQMAAGFDMVGAAARRAKDEVVSLFDVKSGRYDAEGFAKNTAGQRVVAAGQLKPPDDSGNWEFVNEARPNVAAAAAEYPSLAVQGGYWKRKPGTSASPSSSFKTSSSSASTTDASTSSASTTDASTSYTTSTPAAVSQGRLITLQIGSQSTSFTVGSAAEAARLESFLAAIGNASLRSS